MIIMGYQLSLWIIIVGGQTRDLCFRSQAYSESSTTPGRQNQGWMWLVAYITNDLLDPADPSQLFVHQWWYSPNLPKGLAFNGKPAGYSPSNLQGWIRSAGSWTMVNLPGNMYCRYSGVFTKPALYFQTGQFERALSGTSMTNHLQLLLRCKKSHWTQTIDHLGNSTWQVPGFQLVSSCFSQGFPQVSPFHVISHLPRHPAAQQHRDTACAAALGLGRRNHGDTVGDAVGDAVASGCQRLVTREICIGWAYG